MNILQSQINPGKSDEKPIGPKDWLLLEKCLPQMDPMTGHYLQKQGPGYDELNRSFSNSLSHRDVPYF